MHVLGERKAVVSGYSAAGGTHSGRWIDSSRAALWPARPGLQLRNEGVGSSQRPYHPQPCMRSFYRRGKCMPPVASATRA
eukprot:365289-Chlamydomonas_euryale.AAC.19